MAKKVHVRIPAFFDGYKAFTRGYLNCPYKTGTFKAKEWEAGFNSAYFDNLKRIAK